MKQHTVDARGTKMNRKTRSQVAAGAVLAAAMSTLSATGAHGAGLGPVGGAIGETKLLADLRLRSETVDQAFETFFSSRNAISGSRRNWPVTAP